MGKFLELYTKITTLSKTMRPLSVDYSVVPVWAVVDCAVLFCTEEVPWVLCVFEDVVPLPDEVTLLVAEVVPLAELPAEGFAGTLTAVWKTPRLVGCA